MTNEAAIVRNAWNSLDLDQRAYMHAAAPDLGDWIKLACQGTPDLVQNEKVWRELSTPQKEYTIQHFPLIYQCLFPGGACTPSQKCK